MFKNFGTDAFLDFFHLIFQFLELIGIKQFLKTQGTFSEAFSKSLLHGLEFNDAANIVATKQCIFSSIGMAMVLKSEVPQGY